MHEKEFSRKSFVKGGGALFVGFSLAGAVGKAAKAADSPFSSNGPPDLGQVDSFIAIHADNTASIKTGRVEIGQGSTTGLLLLAAEELDMDMSQLIFVRHDTNVTPNTGGTFGSSSISSAGPRVRSAAATAKQALLSLAATNLGVPVASLTVSKGVVSGGGKTVSYGALIGDKLFSLPMAAQSINPGVAPSKAVSAYSQVGLAKVARVDIPAKVTGTYAFVHNIRVPGMLHGRIVRPRGQGSYGGGSATNILSVDASSIAHIPGARVLRRNDFLGVVATKEYDAIQAAAQLKVTYGDPPAISGSGNLYKSMRDIDSAGQAPARLGAISGNVDSAFNAAATKLTATYKYQYNGHMPIGPTCAVADVTATGALVMTNTQDAYTMRNNLHDVLGLPVNAIRVQYWEGASTFGNAPARHDGGLAAAVLSQLAGAPVRLQFMRWDEHGWDNFGPPQLADMRGAVDATGNIIAYDMTQFMPPGISQTADNPVRQHVGLPIGPLGLGALDTTNSGTQYNLANRRVIGKTLPGTSYFKTSTMRAPQAPQTCFASEQFVDELAHAANMDPVAFRLQNISTTDQNRWHDSLVGSAKLANWQPRVANSVKQTGDVRKGRGIALGSFGGSQAGAVVDIEVNVKTGRIAVKHAYSAQVAGLTVYLDGAVNQMEGNLVQGASRALLEEVGFNNKRQTSLDWVTYPILRFKDSPNVSTLVVQRTDLAPSGSGEPPTCPVAAAIANAFFDATGARIREAPMTPSRVRGVLKAAGVV
ncbi:MAG TPA: molybdopterin cofactor-binding domain-containing protein [Gaiellaceae bacterium]